MIMDPYKLLLMTICALLMTSSLSRAESPTPMPDSKTEALAGLREHLKLQKEQEKSIQNELESTRAEINSIRNKLVSISSDIQRSEEEMATLEKHVSTLNAEQQRLKETLLADRVKSSRLALALQRISQIPPEALMARPSSPVETVHSGILIQSSIPLIQKEAKRLRKNLDRLQDVSKQLVSDRKELLKTRQNLNDQKIELAVYLEQRQDYYRQTQDQYDNIHAHIVEISAQAQSLEELVRELEKQKQTPLPPRPVRKASFKAKVPAYKPLDEDLAPRLPVSGIIQTAYGDQTSFRASSRGLEIKSRENGLVVAPMAGVVKFAGEFGKFGRVIIIQHKDNYHSLISGLDRVNTVVGQSVATGEPVGLMGSSIAGRKPVLYYELRRSGKPVDPSIKFSGLS